MEKLIIQGGNRLEGRVRVSSAKNAVLPIIAGTLLASTPSKLLEIPNLEDVGTICQVIESLGVKITRNEADDEIIFDASTLTATEAPYELVRKMRASFLVMGPLLARKGEAKISMPGGCAIGARPIDLHLKAFEALGAKIEITEDYVYAHAPEGLKGTQIYLDFPSVGATENVIMAASMAEGKTVIENAAEETEIVDLLLANESILIDFQYMTEVQARRCLDYLDGARYVLAGNLRRVASTMYLLTPINVVVNIEDIRLPNDVEIAEYDFDMKRNR